MRNPRDLRHFADYHALWKIATYSGCAVRNETVKACRSRLRSRFQLCGQRWDAIGVKPDGYLRNLATQAEWYQRSRLGLSGNHGQLQSGLPFRIWELANCGACIVTQDAAELADYFEPEVECVSYGDADEAVAKIDRLLGDPKAAARIAAAGHRRALACHQWSHRIDTLFERMELRNRPSQSTVALSSAN